MAKKTIVKTLTVDDLIDINHKIDKFIKHDFDEHSCDRESIEINIYSDGSMSIKGKFYSYVSEDLEI